MFSSVILKGRVDDNIQAIPKRFQVYFESTLPVIDYYSSKGKVQKVIFIIKFYIARTDAVENLHLICPFFFLFVSFLRLMLKGLLKRCLKQSRVSSSISVEDLGREIDLSSQS